MARHRRADAEQVELPRKVEETALLYLLSHSHLPPAPRIRPVIAVRRPSPKDAA